MIKLRNFLSGCASLALLLVAPAFASAQTQALKIIHNERNFQPPVVAAGLTYSNATTSYTDVTGFTMTGPTVYDPAQKVSYNGVTQFDHLYISWELNVNKATSLGGTCAVVLNGNVLANSVRTFTPAAWPEKGTLSGYYDAYYDQDTTAFNTGSGGQTQVVKLQCKSADTAAFTVVAGSLVVRERF